MIDTDSNKKTAESLFIKRDRVIFLTLSATRIGEIYSKKIAAPLIIREAAI